MLALLEEKKTFSIHLPQGKLQYFDRPISINKLLTVIDFNLADEAIAAKVNGSIVDLSVTIDTDSSVSIVTEKSFEGLNIIRHSTAHLLAYAVKILFPEVQLATGPVIENGFYYDFEYKRPFTLEDLKHIEHCMYKLIKLNEIVVSKIVSRNEAIAFFTEKNEKYKVEIVQSLNNDKITLYSHGKFTDLCRGPHVPNTGKIKFFKLIKVAGAYWKGNINQKQLQRIYGTAWVNLDQQENYLYCLEEAKKRDHRKIGKQLNLFHFQEEAPGMTFWHPLGWSLYKNIKQYLRVRLEEAGYDEVHTPIIMNKSLWQLSGHWENYYEYMFTTSVEKNDYAIKPMNCPGHILLYNQGIKSYRDMPIRYAEFGSCHRNETSGALHGLMRLRSFVQDDAHIFCTEEQINSETIAFNKLAMSIYKDFGFESIVVKLSLRPQKRVGSDEMWNRAETSLRYAMKSCKIEYQELLGDGAFYGPKIEYHIKDAIGRSWQCGTLQLDFILPERLNTWYINKHNTKNRPVMLHRAILGSIERFIGILIEHYSGSLPTWISPLQVIILTITDSQVEYAKYVMQILRKEKIRVICDLHNEKISYKIRQCTLQKVPYLLILGSKEQNSQTVTVRARNGQNLGTMPIINFCNLLISNNYIRQ